jgi:hypothetical protein
MLASDRGVTLERACRAQEGRQAREQDIYIVGSEKRDIYNTLVYALPKKVLNWDGYRSC